MAELFHYFHHHLLVAYRRGVKFFFTRGECPTIRADKVLHSLSRQVYLQFEVRVVKLLANATFTLIFPLVSKLSQQYMFLCWI